MRLNHLKSSLKTAILAASVLLLGVGLAGAQVNLTAAPTTLVTPDGATLPMWGYACGTAVTGATATCAKLNPAATGWSPVVITVPTGQSLSISLTNSLSFANGNTVPTSLVIVGQIGGGLGDATQRTTTPAPDHSNAQPTTWPIAGTPPGTAPVGVGTPPTQGPRVQSFSTEVAAGTTTALTWTTPRPGTYLIESGTHPSIQGPMGLYGILVVTAVPSGATAGTAYPGVSYNAEVPLLLSEIDPVQNIAVNAAVNNAGFSETKVWSGQPGGCGNPGSGAGVYQTCYPPAVNYSPLYYLFNGVALDKTHASASLFPVSPASGVTGTVLVRLVNAGLRMHVPAIVGAQTGTAATPGLSLIAEDGNPLPGLARVQSEVFLAPGKTYDVAINAPATVGSALPIYDRELSLSGNATTRDAGMLAYISLNGAALPSVASFGVAAVANPDTYNSLVPCAATPCPAFTVSDAGKGVVANDVNVYGVKVLTPPTHGTLTLNTDGTFSYVPSAAGLAPDSFVYQANGAGPTATVTLGAAPIEGAGGITVRNDSYTATATSLSIASPGVLANDTDALGYPLKVAMAAGKAPVPSAGLTLSVDATGAFHASATTGGAYTFTYYAQNSQGTVSATAATASITFPTPSGLKVTVLDGYDKTTTLTDYRWIIEEDRTFYINPNCTTNPPPAGCPASSTGIVPTFGTNFHTSYMPVIAAGCVGPSGAIACESGQTIFDPTTGTHVPAVCDIGNGVCRPGTQQAPLDPGQVYLDPNKRYYISVLPGDAGNPFATTNLTAACSTEANVSSDPTCGHGMGGAPIAVGQTAVTIYVQRTPFPPAKLSVFVFEDDFPLNGEQDAGGGIDVLASNEPGLGGFNVTLFDDAGGTGDATGQMTYDMFNQPLVNSLAGTIDPATQLDACPISPIARVGDPSDVNQTGITGTIVTCPKYESGGTILSPLAGQVIVANLMPGRYGVVATPAADRIARGEEWLQTNTLDGQKAHDSFLRIGEPSFFQEFGPAGYHVSIGFANPAIIQGRLKGVCNGSDVNVTATNCTNTVKGLVTTERMSRTPDERLYSSGTNDSFSFTQCYVSLGDPDGEDFAFTKCNPDGTFSLAGIPQGTWRITVFDQWNDMLVDGLSTPVLVPGGGGTIDMGQIAMNQWQANIYTTTFFDQDGNGVRGANETGLTLLPTNIRFRDGSYSNFNNTDLNGYAGFNEEFPLFSWYVVESDTTRYKNTGTHVVYDAGGPADGTTGGGTSAIGQYYANTVEQIPLPSNLHVPGARYCGSADCPTGDNSGGSTGRVDPAWVETEGWQGFSGQNSFIEFGKRPIQAGETGGIHGEVIYASTRPFDDPTLLIHTSWTPDVPGVTMNLYQEGTAPDGSASLTLVDTTKTSSWDDWAQGFRSDGIPNMNCPGQGRDTGTIADLFFFTLYNQPMWLDVYNNGINAATALPENAQFKCYDGMHNWNQLQPAPYDGKYEFPSIIGRDPSTGTPTGTGTAVNGASGSRPGSNCTICVANPVDGTPMLPVGKYVVEMIIPPGYELVKEEDKNILIGDNYIAPVTQEFPGLGSAIYILPDQAQIASGYNANNAQNPTNDFGSVTFPRHEGDTGSVEEFWPCVGASRIVPDYISLFPDSHEVAPFAGATRNLCDRKEITVNDQESELAKFWIFTSTHVAAHFTGVITDDFTSEFDPFSPQFGEKFSPPNMPIALKDWTGQEISRVYSDQWGTYNGLTYSTWEVNPPNPTGYAPTMMVTCMNDPGTAATPDPLYNPEYSQFCYEIPFMPGQTQYMDTPVVPTSAFAGAGYNNPDCALPALTPAIKEVDGDGLGPWVSKAGNTLTITALGDTVVPNNAYSGPSAGAPPFNQKTVSRHYGFGTTAGSVTIGGMTVPASSISWTDTTISFPVPSSVPTCTIQQQSVYGGPTGTGSSPLARCGELVITTATGQKSTDTVTVTVGGKAPTHILASGSMQNAIDKANPGDLLIVDPGVHNEMLLMWKPLRLQGVGAASSVINANSQPAGKLNPWRAQVNCLFGLALNGQPLSTPGHLVPEPGNVGGVGADGNPTGSGYEPLNAYDPTGASSCPGTGWTAFVGQPNAPQVDRIPLEGIVGWDTTLNGNLAELLQEPTLMGAYEGAAITVLAKGVKYPVPPAGSGILPINIFGQGQDTAAGSSIAHEGQFPVPTVVLTSNDCLVSGSNPFPSNFQCNPSSIDGLSITDSSQGGGGIYVHGWGHNIEISNNRVYNNTGTLTGGITIGQGESPDALLAGNSGDPIGYNGGTLGGFDQQPWTCLAGAVARANNPYGYDQVVSPPGTFTNEQLPYCYNIHVDVHNNEITRNSSIGDELFSSTPAGAGGVTFATGSDYYTFKNNFVCGNLSTGDGGGLAHLGFSWNGDIENNEILFNQATNSTIPTNGGGVVIMGAAPDGTLPGAAAGTECGSTTDVDCAPGLSDGTGPGLKINANLIMGNSADSGSGGGLRFQSVNGTEVGLFRILPNRWNAITVTNNIIVNNVAGWDGAGVSLQDALVVNLINNTIMHNDTTASSGVLFDTIGAPLASAPGANCIAAGSAGTASCPQVAGLVIMRNTPLLTSSLAGIIPTICPAGHYAGLNPINGSCKNFSYPLLYNDVFWQNRSFYIGVGALGTGTENQQNVVSLYNSFLGTPAASQTATGSCPTPVSYWDIGVRGDTGPTNHLGGVTLAPQASILTSTTGYPGSILVGPLNTAADPGVNAQYCNGSRIPPEFGGTGYQVPPGISDATVPNPIFNLTPAATVDEGNNWINLSWGPLTLVNPLSGVTLGNYTPASASSGTVNKIPPGSIAGGLAPLTDFFGATRRDGSNIDIGAVEFRAAPVTLTSINPATDYRSTSFTVTLTGTNLTGATAVTVSGLLNGITVSNVTAVNATTATATFTIGALAPQNIARDVTVTATNGTATLPGAFTVIPRPTPALTSILPNTGVRGASVPVTLTGTNLTGTTAITVSSGGGTNGITVSGITVVSDTTVTATFAISSTASLSARNVTLTSAGGSSNAVTFTVSGATLTSIAPTSGARGTSVPVTLTGANLTGATAVNVSGTGVTVSGVTVVNSTTVTATFAVSGTATLSNRNVTVTTPIGTTNGVTFTVGAAPAPALVAITAASGLHGTTVPVTLTGTNLTGASLITISGGSVKISSLIVVNDSTVTANFAIDKNAGRNARIVKIKTPGGDSNTVTFTVQ